MQDDKTTASEATAKHRNSRTMSGSSGTPALLSVPSTESASSTVSQRRLMRLSEKMSFVKSKKGSGALSPSSGVSSLTMGHQSESPIHAVSGDKRNLDGQSFDRHVTSDDEDVDEAGLHNGEEEEAVVKDIMSDSSPVENAGVGVISPVEDTPCHDTVQQDENHPMDRIESQREHRSPARDFLPRPSSSLSNVPEDEPVKHTNRNRTPGGAAAKVMLVGPHTSVDEDDVLSPRTSPTSSTGSERRNALQAALDHARNKAKSQFNMLPIAEAGNQEDPIDPEEYRLKLVKESPHLFNRNEVFHIDSETAISALQTSRSFVPSDSHSVYSGSNVVMLSSDNISVAASVTSAFQTPSEFDADTAFESVSRKDVSDELLTYKAQQCVESLRDEMQDPSPTLANLLQTIGSDPEGDTPDLGKTVRRKNACGALQVLTAKPSNRIPLAWTVGVLPALCSVLNDTGTDGTHVTYPDKRHRREFEVARDRAILCLVNLATPKENRIPIFHCPNLVHWLVAMILEGQGQPRKGACAVFAYLAKTVENRLLMVQVPRLVEALCKVLKRRPPRMEYPQKQGSSVSSPETIEEEDNTTLGEHTLASGDSFMRSAHEIRSEHTGTEGVAPAVSKTTSGLTEPSRFVSVSSSYSNHSGATQRLAGARSPIELDGYDETADESLREARNYTFAALCQLVKEKDNAYHFARDTFLVKVMSEIARCHESPSHEHAVKFLACLTKHRLNSKVVVFRRRLVVPALVEATTSPSQSARLYACYGLQNLSQDKSCRQELAITENLLVCLCERARGATDQEEERLAALSALKNLTDEPANLIPMSNTTDCIATLMHLAHGRQEGVTPLMQYRACDALATL
eukprot:scaffold5899_cov167-Amphora_coffeaeformis.AAC.1